MVKDLRYPKCGFVDHRPRVERVLLLACYQRHGVPSVVETLEFIQRLSEFPVTVLNLYEHRTSDEFLSLPPGYDLSAFSCVVIHNTVSYNPDNLRSLDKYLKIKLSDYGGVKILFKQDDHYRFKETAEYIISRKIDAVFTLIPDSEVSKVYGFHGDDSEVDIIHMLAGYVTPQMREFTYSENRQIDVGYRGSIMPLSFGRLCFEKRKIGDDVQRILSTRTDLVLDISSRWEDRLGGMQWSKFLRNCKSVLGVESGSGIFDLDGNLSMRCSEIEKEIGPFSLDHGYAESYLNRLSDIEGNVKYFSISPRHFEAIASGTVQILFPGAYTGRMIPNRHYLELSKDYTNLETLVDSILDPDFRRRFTECAFEEVILDKRNWIEGFVSDLDGVIEKHLARKASALHRKIFHLPSSEVKNILLIQPHEYGADPRRDDWLSKGAGSMMRIHQMVVHRDSDITKIHSTEDGSVIYSLPYKDWKEDSFYEYAIKLGLTNPIVMFLTSLRYLSSLPDLDFSLSVGAASNSQRASQLRWYINYVLSTTATLLKGFSNVRGYGAVIAVNLPTLLAGVMAKMLWGIPVIYEALEYWPEADPESEQFEIDFWVDMERFLLTYVDYCNTVSPGLAALMANKYGRDFETVPNCCPLRQGVGQDFIRQTNANTRFIFQGSFAPSRGLEELIKAFSSKHVNACLHLRGKDNSYRGKLESLAKDLGVLGKKVFFLPPVNPQDLVFAARKDGDVGVIPYMPHGENYKNCSPNKLGQFFAAHLPILANKTDFVAMTVEESRSGIVVDFSNYDELVGAIRSLSDDRNRRVDFSNNSKKYFEEYFNWDNLSKGFYVKLNEISAAVSDDEFVIYNIEKKKLYSDVVIEKTIISKNSAMICHGPLRRIWYKLPGGLRRVAKPIKDAWVNWMISLK